jgi:hypothetical protein
MIGAIGGISAKTQALKSLETPGIAAGYTVLTALTQFQTVSTVSAPFIEMKTPGFNAESPTAGTLS